MCQTTAWSRRLTPCCLENIYVVFSITGYHPLSIAALLILDIFFIYSCVRELKELAGRVC